MKHIVKSVALVLALLALCAGICAVAEEENEPIPLTLNVEAEAVIEQAGGYAYFSFTPEETDWYEFTSLADTDTYGYLYDEDMNQLSSNDDGGTGNNFKITYELEEGVPYIFGVRYYSISNTGSFNVVLRSSNHLTASAVGNNDKYVVPEGSVELAVSASCKNGELYYQWFGPVYDEDGNYTMSAFEGATSPSYTVENISRYTQYYCRVSDDFENSTQVWFNIYIDNQLTVIAEDGDRKYVEPGADVDLVVNASCTAGNLHFQWYGQVFDEFGNSNGMQAIEGANTATCTVENVVRYTQYYCRVSDDFDNSTQIWFYISIDNQFTASAVDSNSKYVEPEADVDLEVSASCTTGGLYYQWYDGSHEAIEGATSPSYTVENVSRYTQYYCRVSDDFDNSTQIWFSIYIDNQFTASAVDSNSKYVEPEADVDLEVSASCTAGDLHYQWYGRVYDASGSYTTQAIEGATTNSYTVQNAVRYTSYYCRVSDDFGNATNVWFYIYIDNQLTVNAVGGSNKYVEPGTDVDLAVSASCKNGEIHYRWLYRDEDTGNYLTISGADSASIRVENVLRWCEYRCDVSDDYGNSRNLYFHISIENHLSVERIGKYRVSVLPGETVTLAVSASCASGGLYYQWYDGDEDEPIEGATGSSYVLENYMGRGEFYCRVEDDYGNSDSVWFYAFLDNGLNVDDRYVQVAVPYGETATLTVSAYCDDGPITYQWLQETYNEEEDEWYSVEIEGANTDTWTTGPVTTSAEYWCEMRDQYDNYAEARFEVFVQNGFSASRVGEHDAYFTPEDTAMLAVEAHCDEGELTYSWYGDYYDGEEWDYHSLDADGPTCTLPEGFRHGDVYCTVSDMYGQRIEISFYAAIESDLDAYTEDDTVLRLTAGSTATLRITATHSEQYGELRYRWYKNGHVIEGATAAEYITQPLTASARYYCEVQDDYSERRVEFLCIVDEVAIALDTPTEVTLENNDMRYFAFTPAETDTYTLESSGDHDTYAYLFDADFDELGSNDDGGDDTNFKLTRELIAGQKYYYGIRFYDDESGTFTVLLTRGGGSSSAERYHLYLRPGQTVSFPDVDHEEWSESVEELYSPNSGLLDTDGTSVTALAAGTAELVVRYSENERIYTVDIVDGVQIATPAALREIQEEAFADDASLQFVVLGDAVTRVGKNAFRGSGLKQIVVPSRTTILTAASMRGTTDDLVIVCRRNSRAAKFAQDHEIEYVYMD